jgi:transaldolase/glucose-6-phosphate isomerase
MNVIGKTATGNSLQRLGAAGQAPWLDFIQRSFVAEGKLKALVDNDGLRGVTSNPSIFEKAMGHGTEYDPEFKEVAGRGELDASAIYETLAITDIRNAADVLKPVWDEHQGLDGYVSLEVSPYLALTTEPTIVEARRLWSRVDRKNLMVKVPGTDAGVPAIRTLIGDGININVTLLFSVDAYRKVLEAYIAGLEDRVAKGLDVKGIASVASFFVSRIDGKIDGAIDKRIAAGDKDAEALKAVRGKVAIANAKLAYQHYVEVSASDRWQALAAKGAFPQRLLWASTGTKDKAYSDVLYVEELIGPDTVNTMPPATMDAFRDHGDVRPSLTEDLDGAKHVLAETDRLGLDLPGVTSTLVAEGVKSFAEAFDALLGAVAAKRTSLIGDAVTRTTLHLPKEIDDAVAKTLDTWRADGTIRRLWLRDASVWTGQDEGKWLAWLDVIDERLAHADELEAFAKDASSGEFDHVLLLGMGGSSLGPEVLAETFGKRGSHPELLVLDSTDPQQIATFQAKIDPARTLFIVSSKSGGTLEPNILKAYFFKLATDALGEGKAGAHFVTVTDPGSHMEEVAKADGFRKIFYGDKQIGGRYSVLSNFGLVPAAACGIDVREFLKVGQLMARSCADSVPPLQNPGVVLGTVLGVAATQFKRDKVTIVASPGIADMGAWLEQLLAESTGKDGRGLVPIDNEALGAPAVYGHDRVFAYLRLDDAPDASQDSAVKALAEAGHPVVTIDLPGKLHIAQEFFRWEIATAVAGSIIGINAFNQPDVEASKIETKKLTDAYNQTGTLPEESPFAIDDTLSFFADGANAAALGRGDAASILRAHFARVGAGDYVGILAYIERDRSTRHWIENLRLAVRDKRHVATAAEFGPRFLHSTGQAYKGGPDSGVFLQVTADDAKDLPVPGAKYTFGTVKAAQARGDFDVLSERGRRALRVHIKGDLKSGLERLSTLAGHAL